MANISAIKLPDGNKYNLVDETSGYITSSDLPTPLIGTTANTTPTQVKAALDAGRDIIITHTDSTYGDIVAYSFNYSDDIEKIVSNSLIDVFGWVMLIRLIGNIDNNTWSCDGTYLAKSADIPTKTSDLTNDSGFITVDEKVKTDLIPSTSTTYYLTLSSSESSQTSTLLKASELSVYYNLDSMLKLILGKSNVAGRIRLYSTGTKYAELGINGGLTSNRTIYLPDKAGTVALTDDLPTKTSDLTNDSGFITSYTDEKVKQTPLNGLASYKGLLFGSNSGNSETTSTIYTSDKILWNDSIQVLLLSSNNGNIHGYLTIALTSDIPPTPLIPTDLSDLNNDLNVSDFPNDAGYITLGDLPIYNGGVS